MLINTNLPLGPVSSQAAAHVRCRSVALLALRVTRGSAPRWRSGSEEESLPLPSGQHPQSSARAEAGGGRALWFAGPRVRSGPRAGRNRSPRLALASGGGRPSLRASGRPSARRCCGHRGCCAVGGPQPTTDRKP